MLGLRRSNEIVERSWDDVHRCHSPNPDVLGQVSFDVLGGTVTYQRQNGCLIVRQQAPPCTRGPCASCRSKPVSNSPGQEGGSKNLIKRGVPGRFRVT